MKAFCILFLLCLPVISFGQTPPKPVEKSIYGIQTGLLGVWLHTERQLSTETALRLEVGLDGEIFGGTFHTNTGFVLVPSIIAEPRWYYNLDQRADLDKITRFNSGNFLTIKFQYHPDWFLISSYNISVVPDVAIIPKWGIKRRLTDDIIYEAGIGLGYRRFFLNDSDFNKNEGEAAIDLHLRIGFSF